METTRQLMSQLFDYNIMKVMISDAVLGIGTLWLFIFQIGKFYVKNHSVPLMKLFLDTLIFENENKAEKPICVVNRKASDKVTIHVSYSFYKE